MIDLYYWTTPNGHKITMFLEEVGLPYKIFPINIGKGEQFKPEFLTVAPNNRIPAMVDHEPKGGGRPISIFESGAMLLYLAEKTGKFIPSDIYGRYDVIQWTFWQMGGLGPMAGQNHHFRNYALDKIPYAIDRYVNETNRLYGVLNKRLSDREYIGGDYSIADMACYPWVVPYKNQGQDRAVSASQALARDDQGASRYRARLRQGEGGQSEFRAARDPHRGRAQDPVRTDLRGSAIGRILAQRQGLACPGHPRFGKLEIAWMPATSAGMTSGASNDGSPTLRTGGVRCRASVQPVLLANANGGGT